MTAADEADYDQQPPEDSGPARDYDVDAERFERAAEFHRQVAREAERIKVTEAARGLVRAEKAASTNFNEQFLDRADLLNLPAPDPLIDRILPRHAYARLAAEKEASLDFTDLYLTRSQLLNLPAPDPLIGRVLPRHSYAILRGRDHSFKSFVAIDWACCLATGKPWQGHPVEQVPVLYIAGEGVHGIAARLEAWEYAWGHNVPAEMFTVRASAPNMHQPGPAFDHLIDHVTARGYGLIIVDTLRRVSGAADGNSSEMGLVVDNLDRLKRATNNGTVLAVAHTDKGDHDTRGYSGIEDDADVVWAAKREQMFLELTLAKMKDGPDGRIIHLEAQRTVSSLTLSGSDGTAEVNTSESQLAILDALRIMPEGGVTGPDLMATAGLGKASFYRALSDLREAGHVAMSQVGRTRYYELPPLPVDASDQATDQEDQ